LSAPLWILVQAGVFGAVMAGLAAGRPGLAWALGLIAIVNGVLMYRLGSKRTRLLAQDGFKINSFEGGTPMIAQKQELAAPGLETKRNGQVVGMTSSREWPGSGAA
jgi:hypothetical protein